MRVRDVTKAEEVEAAPSSPLARVEGWIFGPGTANQLAAVRIGLCSLLAIRLSRPLFLQLAGQPPALFRPLSFMHLFHAMPSRPVVLSVQIVGIVTAVLAAIGLWSRATLPAAFASGLFLNGMATSVGKVVHNDVLLLLALVPLVVAPTGDAWSVDAIRRRVATPGPSIRYGWPVRVSMLVVAGGYFFTGLAKLIFSGPAWFLTDNLRWVLYTASDAQRAPNALGLFVADRPILAHLLAFMTIVVEAGFPIVLWKRRALWFFLPGVVLLHLSIWLTMRLDYSAWALTALIVFVDWPLVVSRLRRPAYAG